MTLFHLSAPGHAANVVVQAAPVGTTALAWCPCGYQAATKTRQEAQALADAHVEEHA